ncbi:Mediator of RNA polymerase II transcription subunit 33B [Glycine max]|nr:Mediator of RNA polymerase II transcription subunit 33B [Glycine max]
MPHLDTRLCMLLCVIPLVGDLIEEEEERKPVDEKDNGPTDYWKEKKVAGKCRDDLVLSLQVLGDYQSLLTPPQSVLAAAKAMLFVSGITIGSAYFDCLNMTEMPVDCYLGPLNTKDLEQLEHQLDSSLKQVRSTKIINTTNNVKNTIFPHSSPQTLTQTLNPPPHPPPMAIDDHHKPPLLAAEPPHGVEAFDRSGIFKTQLVDSVENGALDPPFAVSSSKP